MHPHQLRHTLATQAINRGMRLEAIAALLGHRSMEMTLTYARIADRVVADEYEAVTEQIDMLYNTAGTHSALPAEIETAAMTRLRREAHARMLGNGLCTRPVELECRMESACETCAYFQTGPEFVPVILRQRDHARDHHQPDRASPLRRPPRTNRRKQCLTTITRITPGRCADRPHGERRGCGRRETRTGFEGALYQGGARTDRRGSSTRDRLRVLHRNRANVG